MQAGKIMVGLVEPVRIIGPKGEVEVLAKFDTGARRTSIDKSLVQKIKPSFVGRTTVRNVHGTSRRPLVRVNLRIKGKNIKTKANVADRRSRRYKIIIGRDVIFSNFVIDITLSHSSPNLDDLNESMRHR